MPANRFGIFFGKMLSPRTGLAILATLLSLVTIAETQAFGQRSDRSSGPTQRTLGLGVALINPTGLALKYRLSRTRSIEAATGWSRNWVHLHVHYLADEITLTQNSDFDLDFNYGAGLHLESGRRNAEVGVRFPAGLVANLSKVPIDIFAQIALVVGLVSESSIGLDLTLGGRYFF
jgi:hypothetical protein